MPKTIANKAFKFSFMQTTPGEEFNVVRQLKQKCADQGIADSCAILKGLGSYDVIFIYASDFGYDSVLTKGGPIKGIVRTSRFFCFQYLHEEDDASKFFEAINKAAFASFSFIKLKAKPLRRLEGAKKVLEKRIARKDGQATRGFGFGTLGWVDLAIVKIGNSLQDIVEDVFSATQDNSELVLKSYSSFAISYGEMPTDVGILANEEELTRFFKPRPAFDVSVPSSMSPRILISYEPLRAKPLVRFWREKKYRVYGVTGKDDLCVLPQEGGKLSSLLIDLLSFRFQYKHSIYSTETKFDKLTEIEETLASELDPEPPFLSFIDYNYDELEDMFNESSALNLASNLNSLNGLLQSISSDAFDDMRRFFKYIIRTGKGYKDKSGGYERVTFANQCANLIKNGAELRLYGTHGTMDESVGQFTKLRGGVQKSLLAIEYIPSWIIKRITQGKFAWSGFVVTGSREFLNINSVISVPYDALWKPTDWWPIYHELAHTVLEYQNELLDLQLPEIKLFLANKEVKDYWYHIVTEFAAEVIGFEFGFFDDFQLYMDCVWNYLREFLPGHDNISPFNTYCVRTFFVKIYQRLFYVGDIDQSYLEDHDTIYYDLLEHFQMIKEHYFDGTPYSNNVDFSDAYFVAAQNAPLFKELYPWMKDRLYSASSRLKFKCDISNVDHPNTKEVFQSVLDGNRWDSHVVSPEAVLYHMIKKGARTYENSMAFIMTLWNLYQINNLGGASARYDK